jgi:RimJ/RimL family protein N-acetyltransferase
MLRPLQRRAARPELETARLRLRQWRREDLEAFVRIRGDAEVARFLGDGTAPSPAACRFHLQDRMRRWRQYGIDAWAAELRETGELAGWAGLTVPERRPPGSPLEIGWVLDRRQWGRGLATEAAAAALEWGFERMHLPLIAAHHHAGNAASARVMSRLGMAAVGDRQDPALGYRVCVHEITCEEWRARSPGGTPCCGDVA